MEQTIDLLLSNKTDADHPGMLLGDIHSGKTRAFLRKKFFYLHS